MVQGLWDPKVRSIIYVKLGDAETYSYKYQPMTDLLARWETIKKTITVSNVMTNGNTFCRSFSQWTEL